MDTTVSTGLLVLLGTVIGAAAGTVGQLVAASIASRSDRRRVAVDAAFREWEHMAGSAAFRDGAALYPPVLFVYFNSELLRLIDDGKLDARSYRALLDRRDEMRTVIRTDTHRRREEDRLERQQQKARNDSTTE